MCKDQKREFYRNRIRWKAERGQALDSGAVYFSELSNEKQKIVLRYVGVEFDPVLVYWSGPDKWTVIGTNSVASLYNGSFVTCKLDDIGKDIGVHHKKGATQEEIKFKSSYIDLRKCGVLIWGPSGEGLFTLMNILRMFPVGKW